MLHLAVLGRVILHLAVSSRVMLHLTVLCRVVMSRVTSRLPLAILRHHRVNVNIANKQKIVSSVKFPKPYLLVYIRWSW